MTEDERVGSIKYTDLRIEALKCEIMSRLEAMALATKLQSEWLDKKLDSMDVDGKFLPRTEFQIAHDKLEEVVKEARDTMSNKAQADSQSDRISRLELGAAKMEGKADKSSVDEAKKTADRGTMIGIGGLLFAAIGIILHFVEA